MKMLLYFILILIIFSVMMFFFAVGFFIGYTRENKRLNKKATHGGNEQNVKQEEKAKREWKRFLSYDGSSNADVSNLK